MEFGPAQDSLNSSRTAAAYLAKNADRIKTLWELKVFDRSSPADDDRFPVIASSLGVFLNELAAILRQSDPAPERLSEYAMSTVYGGQKAAVEGYPLSRLLWEFALVRETVIQELQRGINLAPEVHSLIDKTIDVAMSLAATEFEKVQSTQLQSLLTKAESSNRDLDQFAMIAAHDLNAPLATLTSLLDLLVESIPTNSPPEAKEYIGYMERALTRMRGLITSLLEYARLSKSTANFEKVDLTNTLQESLHSLSHLIEQTHAQVDHPRLPSIIGDFNLLSLVFQNLISNSIKYRSAAPPKIRITLIETDPQNWIFSVEDNGIGFEIRNKEEIFKLYKRLKTKSEQPGSGIGLATCRKIIELHGGTIWAESHPGVGSTFFFTLPRA